MPPHLALLLSALLTFWMLRSDKLARPRFTPAHALVLLWLMIIASRPVTSWFGGFGSGSSDVEGNTAEALITLSFFIAAFAILLRQNFNFAVIPRANIYLFLLILYFGLSCLWSFLPFVSFKRWFKECGSILIALLIIASPNPGDTLRSICIRSAYVLFPLSIVLIKYFPHLGRAYSVSGQPMVTGVTDQKNALGLMCCIFCLAIIWDIYQTRLESRLSIFSRILRPQQIALCLGLWLLIDSQSKTSLLAFLVGTLIFFATHLPPVRRIPRTFATITFIVIAASIAITSVSTIIAAPILEAVGRDATFTGRTKIWQVVLDQPTNPLFGSGFYIFWNEYGPSVWSNFAGNFFVRSAHNGYIEVYLDGGIAGCALLSFFLLSLASRTSSYFDHHNPFGRAIFAYFCIFVIANFSESYTLRPGPLWFITIVIALAHLRTDLRLSRTHPQHPSAQAL